MQTNFLDEIETAINNGAGDGFTAYLGKEGRYIVAFTHNEANTKEEGIENALHLASVLPSIPNLTIGGWIDNVTRKAYYDFGIALNNLEEALKLGKQFVQIAIWDNEEKKEIRI